MAGCCCTPIKTVKVEYLYLDLKTCDRCIGTDQVLEEVIKELVPALALAGYQIRYKKVKIETEELAKKYQFVSSPTIRVKGKDICDRVQENNCACCGEISGTRVECRVFEYYGKMYEVPPKAMLAEAILKGIFVSEQDNKDVNYETPENLKKFFEGKIKKESDGCCCGGNNNCC